MIYLVKGVKARDHIAIRRWDADRPRAVKRRVNSRKFKADEESALGLSRVNLKSRSTDRVFVVGDGDSDDKWVMMPLMDQITQQLEFNGELAR